MNNICPQLVGTSPVILALKEEIARIAPSEAKVLVFGESGAGKEVVARTIHALSPRADRPFVPVNCAGLPETLLESELFGHVKGSFTGAYRDKRGKLELADSGTVFLDEIGEMTLRMQGMLLRFLETGELQRVGTDRAESVINVRVVSATNRRLEDLIRRGEFRDDLFYRLNVVHFTVPPLRERKADIPLLVDHALGRWAGVDGYLVRRLETAAVQALCEYPWPGNVRELQNVIERLVVTGRHEVVRFQDLPAEFRTGHSTALPRRSAAGRSPTISTSASSKTVSRF